ncbi:MAG: AbrB/MazE/SpoVT family DNA-binding domain-containing protein [Xenococcus sp. (in: cyanobacteria)]
MAIISKWGNSLALRIPKAIAEELQLNEGSPISIETAEGKILITPEKHRKKYTLEELLEGMTEEKFHPEIDTGSPVGAEQW